MIKKDYKVAYKVLSDSRLSIEMSFTIDDPTYQFKLFTDEAEDAQSIEVERDGEALLCDVIRADPATKITSRIYPQGSGAYKISYNVNNLNQEHHVMGLVENPVFVLG